MAIGLKKHCVGIQHWPFCLESPPSIMHSKFVLPIYLITRIIWIHDGLHVYFYLINFSDLLVSCIFRPALHVRRHCVFWPALGWLVIHCYILSQYLYQFYFFLSQISFLEMSILSLHLSLADSKTIKTSKITTTNFSTFQTLLLHPVPTLRSINNNSWSMTMIILNPSTNSNLHNSKHQQKQLLTN